MEYLYILQQALVWIITIFWLYQLAISVCSLVKLKDKPMLINKNHRFMAIIPAHNEENVVAELIESLKKQDYPKELFDCALNCKEHEIHIQDIKDKAGLNGNIFSCRSINKYEGGYFEKNYKGGCRRG